MEFLGVEKFKKYNEIFGEIRDIYTFQLKNGLKREEVFNLLNKNQKLVYLVNNMEYHFKYEGFNFWYYNKYYLELQELINLLSQEYHQYPVIIKMVNILKTTLEATLKNKLSYDSPIIQSYFNHLESFMETIEEIIK